MFRFCGSPVIIPICTKVDTKEDILNKKMCDKILSDCKAMILKSQKKSGAKKKIVLLNKIVHFTSKTNVEDPEDPRKNTKYLRDLVAALCDYYFKGQFFIPNSWDKIGEFSIFTIQKYSNT